jgi:hypothetical protein
MSLPQSKHMRLELQLLRLELQLLELRFDSDPTAQHRHATGRVDLQLKHHCHASFVTPAVAKQVLFVHVQH